MYDTLRHTNRTTPERITIVYGAQCSGKSTFLNIISSLEKTISLGDYVRDAPNSSNIKTKAISLIQAGEVWPVDLGFEFIKNHITKKTTIFDGYPRNVNELHYLLKKVTGIKAISFIYFFAPDKTLHERYIARNRKDSNAAFFNLRLQQAKQFHKDVVSFSERSNDYDIQRFVVNS